MPYKDKEKARQNKKEYRKANLEKVREWARLSARRNKDKRDAYWKEYSSDPENKKKIAEYTKEYHSRPGVLEHKRQLSKIHYSQNLEAYKDRASKRRRERLAVINYVSLSYGCQNPGCSWNSVFETYQLDFHHFDPKTKVKEIAKMASFSFEKLIKEINKCVVLCKNCHTIVHHGDVVLNENMICNVSLEQVLNEIKKADIS